LIASLFVIWFLKLFDCCYFRRKKFNYINSHRLIHFMMYFLSLHLYLFLSVFCFEFLDRLICFFLHSKTVRSDTADSVISVDHFFV